MRNMQKKWWLTTSLVSPAQSPTGANVQGLFAPHAALSLAPMHRRFPSSSALAAQLATACHAHELCQPLRSSGAQHQTR